MQNENDLIKKLMVSKQIMDRHNNISRGSLPSTPMLESYEPVEGNVNIPQEYLSELPSQAPVSQDLNETKIMSSKLPEEIKRLMIEHPIHQPNSMGGPTLSNDLVEKASRLMGNTQKPQVQESSRQPQQQQPSSLEMLGLKEMIRETIREVLSENGLLVESSSKTEEQFNFKVGKHIFEGKVTKIKKLK